MTTPLLQTENRVWRTYKGGKRLDAFLGKAQCVDTDYPEDWISSFVEAKNKNYIPGEGISQVIQNGKILSICDAVQEADFGPGRSNSGVLIKLLDASERLGIQVHPTKEFALQHFGTPYGKTECWHILDADEDAAIYIGFQKGITKEIWADLFMRQDIPGMLDQMHRFPVKRGDTILVTAGTPHAIGAGCFLLEVQEPTDYTMRVEKITVSGAALTPHQIHYGVGEEALLDCFLYDGRTREEARSKYFLLPEQKNAQPGYDALVTYEHTPCFALERVTQGVVAFTPDCFVTIVVTEDSRITFGEETNDYRKGDKILVPYGCGRIRIERGKILICYPPKV